MAQEFELAITYLIKLRARVYIEICARGSRKMMKEVHLRWYGPYNVLDLTKLLRQSVSVSDSNYPELNNYGFYAFFNQINKNIIYVGQAFGASPRSLRNRIRWEITKDGRYQARSAFYAACEEQDIQVENLALIIGHLQKVECREKPYIDVCVDVTLMNDIENALIHQTQPVLNKKGKQNYYGQSLEIFNCGKFKPLPRKIKKYQFTQSQEC